VATDGAGNISNWNIVLQMSPFPGTGNPMQTLSSNSQNSGGSDQVDEGPAGITFCQAIIPTLVASSSAAGSWTSSIIPAPIPTEYIYSGSPITSADPPYSIGDQVTGSITLAGSLPTFLPLTDITASLDDFTFTDGTQTRIPANTNICSFQVATDGAGNIVQWQISLRSSPFPGTGNPVQTLGSSGSNLGIDQVGEAPAGGSVCAIVFLSVVASSADVGTWTSSAISPPTPTDYVYSGSPFTTANPPYSIGGQVTGSITLAGPLPTFLPLTDITAALDDFTFTDGTQTRIPANSIICSFQVATDGAGNIVHWRIFLRSSPFPGVGNPMQILDSSGPIPGFGVDTVGEGSAGASSCASIVLTIVATSSSAGSWIGSIVTVDRATTTPIPTVSTMGLIIMILMLLAISVLNYRKI
jgi:hypothetical protein